MKHVINGTYGTVDGGGDQNIPNFKISSSTRKTMTSTHLFVKKLSSKVKKSMYIDNLTLYKFGLIVEVERQTL